METIAVTRPHMGVLPQDRLALSPFGALAQTFAEELLARTEWVEGRWPYLPLDLLEEEESSAGPQIAPVYQVDLHLVLEALRREQGDSEQRRTVERIVERIIHIRQAHPAPQRGERPQAAQGREQAQLPGTLIGQFYQMVYREAGARTALRPSSGAEQEGWRAVPGGLGQRSQTFARQLQRLREEGRDLSDAGPERTGAEAPAKLRPLAAERPVSQEGLEHLRTEGTEADRTAPIPDPRLRRMAERELERAVDRALSKPLEPRPGRQTPSSPAPKSQDRAETEERARLSEATGRRAAASDHRPRTGTTEEAAGLTERRMSRAEGTETDQRTSAGAPIHPDRARHGKDAVPSQAAQRERAAEATSAPGTAPAAPREVPVSAQPTSGREAPTTARDIRMAGDMAETLSAPLGGGQAEPGQQPGGQVSAQSPIPGVELTYRREEGTDSRSGPEGSTRSGRETQPQRHEDGQTIHQDGAADRETAQSAPAETADSRSGHSGRRPQEGGLGPSQAAQRERAAEASSAPGTAPAAPRDEQAPAQPTSGREAPTIARDIRTAGDTLSAPLGGGQAEPGQRPGGQVSAQSPIPGVELTYRREEGGDSQSGPEGIGRSGSAPQPRRPEVGQSARTDSAAVREAGRETARSAPAEAADSRSGHSGRTSPEGGAAPSGTARREQAAEATSAPGGAPAVPRENPVSAQPTSGREAPTTARDIRTAGDMAETLSAPLGGGQAEPGQRPGGQVSAQFPIPGVELTYRREEGGDSQSGPEGIDRSGSAPQPRRPEVGQAARTDKAAVREEDRETARSAPAETADSKSGHSGRRSPEGGLGPSGTARRARDEQAASAQGAAPAASRDEQAPAQPTSGREAPTTARDIRTAGDMAETLSAPLRGEQAEPGQRPGGQVSAQSPIPGVELTYRREEGGDSKPGPEGAVRSGSAPQPRLTEGGQSARTDSAAVREAGRETARSAPAEAADSRSGHSGRTSPEGGLSPSGTARRERSAEATSAPGTAQVASRDEQAPAQPTAGREAPTTARDIRTLSPGMAQEGRAAPAAGGASLPPVGLELALDREDSAALNGSVPGPAAQAAAREGQRAAQGPSLSLPKTGTGQPAGEPLTGGLAPSANRPGRDIRVSGDWHPAGPGPAYRAEAPRHLPGAAGELELLTRGRETGAGGAAAHVGAGPAPGQGTRSRAASAGVRADGGRGKARGKESLEPVELAYGPAAPEAATARQSQSAERPGEESDFVRSLPDWARRFLRESGGQTGTSAAPMGVAKDISSRAKEEKTGGEIQWTAPAYRPPEAPITYREKKREEQTARSAPAISEAELQRTADRVYRMIEERIRQERRRLGL